MRARATAPVLLTGAAAGFLAGLFGVGGGLVIVPALMAALGMDQRRAAATSLAAIVLTAAVGSVSYGLRGQVHPLAAAVLVAGSLVGAQIGTRLLRRLPAAALPWVFVAFVGFVVVSQQLHAPVREAALVLDAPRWPGSACWPGSCRGWWEWAAGPSSCPASSSSWAWGT